MLFALKERVSKVDGNKYRNLPIPVLDARLNEAQDIYIRLVLAPRNPDDVKLITYRNDMETIRTLIKTSEKLDVTEYDDISDTADIPSDYRYFISGYVNATRRGCDKKLRVNPRKHDDDFQGSPNTASSFLFESCNSTLIGENRIRLYHGNDFVINDLVMDYIRIPKYIHNADKYGEGKYTLLNGTELEGHQDCELPEECHSEIVDIAVAVIRGDFNTPEYQAAVQKLNLLN
jgi:hypothetical protein